MDGTWSTSCSSSHRRSRRGKCAARPPPRAVLTLPPRAVLALPPRAPASAPRTTARAPPRTTARPVPPPRCSHRGRAPTHGAFARCVCLHTGRVRRHLSASGARVGGVGLWWSGWVPGPRWHGSGGLELGQVGMWGGSGTVRLARGPASGPASLVVSLINPRRSAPVPHFSGRSAAGVPRFLGPRGRSRVRKFSHEFSATKTESGWARGGADLRFVIGHMDIWIQHRCILTLCHKPHETCH